MITFDFSECKTASGTLDPTKVKILTPCGVHLENFVGGVKINMEPGSSIKCDMTVYAGDIIGLETALPDVKFVKSTPALETEYNTLMDNLRSLKGFVHGKTADEAPLLFKQIQAMTEYAAVLTERIK